MDSFSWGNAWSLGVRFLASRLAIQALVLIVGAVLVPLGLQYAVTGGVSGMMSPAAMGGNAMGIGPAAAGATLLAVMALAYVVQTASYFSAWRLGFDPGRSPVAAIGYGLIAGLIAVAALGAFGFIAATLAGQVVGSSGAWLLAALVLLVPLAALFAAFWTFPAALVAAGVSMALVVAMLFGAATGQVGLAATLVGGNGAVAVVLLVMSVVMLWLAGRLSCTTTIMAERRSLNPIPAARESWRLTWDEQWSIMRYLAAIGFGFAILIFGLAFAVGAGATTLLPQQGAGPMREAGTALLSLVAGIPIAFLTVMIPAGIHRELNSAEISAEVFA